VNEKPLVDAVEELTTKVAALETRKRERPKWRWPWSKKKAVPETTMSEPSQPLPPVQPPVLSRPLLEAMEELEGRVKLLEQGGPVKMKKWKVKVKLPWKVKSKIKGERVGAVWLGANHILDFKAATIQGGLLKVEGHGEFEYDPVAIYRYKKWPMVVLFEWRLTPAGGRAEEYHNRVLGGEDDVKVAESLKITSYGQQTIIRAIEQAEVKKDEKKKFNMNIIWIIIGVIALGYLALKMFGGA